MFVVSVHVVCVRIATTLRLGVGFFIELNGCCYITGKMLISSPGLIQMRTYNISRHVLLV